MKKNIIILLIPTLTILLTGSEAIPQSKKVNITSIDIKKLSILCEITVKTSYSDKAYKEIVKNVKKNKPDAIIVIAKENVNKYKYETLDGDVRFSEISDDEIRNKDCQISNSQGSFSCILHEGKIIKATKTGDFTDSAYSPIQLGYKILNKKIPDFLDNCSINSISEINEPRFGRVLSINGNYKNHPIEIDLCKDMNGLWKRLVYKSQKSTGESYTTKSHINSFTEVRKMILPSESVSEVIDESGKTVLKTEIKFIYSDKKPIKDDFKLNIKSGGSLYDQEKDTVYRIGPNGERIVDERFGKDRKSNMYLGWLFISSSFILITLSMLGFLKWKSKRS